MPAVAYCVSVCTAHYKASPGSGMSWRTHFMAGLRKRLRGMCAPVMCETFPITPFIKFESTNLPISPASSLLPQAYPALWQGSRTQQVSWALRSGIHRLSRPKSPSVINGTLLLISPQGMNQLGECKQTSRGRFR